MTRQTENLGPDPDSQNLKAQLWARGKKGLHFFQYLKSCFSVFKRTHNKFWAKKEHTADFCSSSTPPVLWYEARRSKKHLGSKNPIGVKNGVIENEYDTFADLGKEYVHICAALLEERRHIKEWENIEIWFLYKISPLNYFFKPQFISLIDEIVL